MKIMILGDTHGSTNEAILAVQIAASLNVPTIIQCGDFGVWPGKEGMDFLDELNAELLRFDIILVFVDGNHEAHDQLERARVHNPKNQFGQVFMRSNILWSPRGTRWKLEGKHFMTVGGAVSVDKEWRVKGKTWWPEEQLTDDELDLIVKRHEASPGPVDYLFTHDCPTNAPFLNRIKDDPESHRHRQRIDRLLNTVKPRFMWHGHMHERYDAYPFSTYGSHTTVYGLACDGMNDNWGVLDTETDKFTWGTD